MKIEYKHATVEDANTLVEIYNRSFYEDYVRFGECPAYGRSIEQMEESINDYPKQIILYDNQPVGVISVENKGNGNYYLGCLCVIPEYQGKGIGSKAVKHFLEERNDWKRVELVTPVAKKENVKFYTQKCGFSLGETEMDGKVQVVQFYMERSK